MTKELALGYSDTELLDNSGNNLQLVVPVNWEADYALRAGASASEVVYANVTSPFDQPSSMRLSQRQVANVYAGYAVDSANQLGNKTGLATLIESRVLWKETSTDDETYAKYVPMRVGLSFTVPVGYNFDSVLLTQEMLRVVGACALTTDWHGTGEPIDGLERIIRGVLDRTV